MNTSKSWGYYDDLIVRSNFTWLAKEEQILWFEHYPNLPVNLINEIKAKPDIFKNWNELSEADKFFLKNIPEEWIPSVYQYKDFCFIKKFSPTEISGIAREFPRQKNGYLQVEFRYTKNGYKWEVRAHTEIPNSPGVGNGNVWVIKREIVSDGTFIPYQEFLSGDDWIRGVVWYDLIAKQKAGIITETEKLILKNGHFKVK